MLAVRLPEDIGNRLSELALEHLDELEDKYLAMYHLENPGRRWALDELENIIRSER